MNLPSTTKAYDTVEKKLIGEYPSQSAAAKHYKLTNTEVNDCVRRKRRRVISSIYNNPITFR